MAKKSSGDLPDPTGRNADRKYYRSGEVSAIQQSSSEGPRQSNIPIPKIKSDDRSTDKYYKEGGTSSQQPGQLKQPRQMQPARRARQPVPEPTVEEVKQLGRAAKLFGQFVVAKPEDVRPVCEAVIEHLLDPSTGDVKVQIVGDSSLAMRVRTYLDLQVSRERITEGQYRDVVISVAKATDIVAKMVDPGRAHAQAPGTVPETRSTEELFGDPSQAKPTLTEPVQEKEVTDIGSFLKVDADDDSGDFLAPPPPTVADEVVVEDGDTGEIKKVPTQAGLKELAKDDADFLAGEPGTVKADPAIFDTEEPKEETKPVPAVGVPFQPKKGRKK